MTTTTVEGLPLFELARQIVVSHDRREKLNTIAKAFGDAPFWRMLDTVFDEMEWVEEEIAVAKRRYPEHAAQIDRLFGLRTRSEVPPGAWSERLARLHIRELIQRTVRGEDLRPPTLAEKLFVISETSFIAPLSSRGLVLYARLFREAFPEEGERIFGEILPAYERVVQEDEVEVLHGKLTRKLYRADRNLKEVTR